MLLAVVVFVATTVVGKAGELAWGHVRMPGVLRELTVGIWYVWLGLAAAVVFYVIVTIRERAKRRRKALEEAFEQWRKALEQWCAATQDNVERVRVGAHTALNHAAQVQGWDQETRENNRIKLEWPPRPK